jgi:hypothetical protein
MSALRPKAAAIKRASNCAGSAQKKPRQGAGAKDDQCQYAAQDSPESVLSHDQSLAGAAGHRQLNVNLIEDDAAVAGQSVLRANRNRSYRTLPGLLTLPRLPLMRA